MSGVVRDFVPSDVAGCMSVMASNVPLFFLAEELPTFERFLESFAGTYLVLEDERFGVAACGGYVIEPETMAAGLAWGMVHRERHRTGLGSVLLRERLRRIRQEGAREVVLDTTQHSRGFFERFGFETVSCRSDGYGPGLDRYDLRLRLTD